LRVPVIEETLGVPVEIAQPFGLQAIGDHAVEQMARQVIGGFAAEHRMPSCPQAWEIEIAQMRDLVLQPSSMWAKCLVVVSRNGSDRSLVLWYR
jgi:hypothetical protein